MNTDEHDYPLPLWVHDYLGLERILIHHAKTLAKMEAKRDKQPLNYEFRDEAEEIIKLASELQNRLLRLNSKVMEKFILGNKEDAIDALRTGFKDGWEPDQSALDTARIGTDPFSMQWALGGLQQYLRVLIEADKKGERSDSKEYQRQIIGLIAGSLERFGLQSNNATAKKYKEAVYFVFYSAGFNDSEIPTDETITQVKKSPQREIGTLIQFFSG